MKIWSLKVDVEHAFWLTSDREDSLTSRALTGGAIENDIDEYFYVIDPSVDGADFFMLNSRLLTVSGRVMESMRSIFEMAGQILSIDVEGLDEVYVVNVEEVVNCVDETKVERSRSGRIIKWAFRDCFTESSLFRVPQHNGKLMTYTGRKDAGEEFKTVYEREGFSGLSFELLGCI